MNYNQLRFDFFNWGNKTNVTTKIISARGFYRPAGADTHNER